ncbi:hypothetical protein DFA_03623 [Cavenderia fasciculata]|uniref:Uncharacterized protein n=1 Tax=Cavenderia fasciculata TaxID=261658 RepID=F4PIE5_CACFS|nr:uncharacterized protein DFA_03623 [Cavenderia fasciculata]EGG25374.1 hypothetical protein DFA_03623 [Cavenderia fasciculata]|eukprot:XP_004363225.1 hypothetical protein DFA_03623 [Cavenderia fasciculata]
MRNNSSKGSCCSSSSSSRQRFDFALIVVIRSTLVIYTILQRDLHLSISLTKEYLNDQSKMIPINYHHNNNNNSICNSPNKNSNNNHGQTSEILLKENLKLKEIIKNYQRDVTNWKSEREKYRKNLERAKTIIIEQRKSLVEQQNHRNMSTKISPCHSNNSSVKSTPSACSMVTSPIMNQHHLGANTPTPTTTTTSTTNQQIEIEINDHEYANSHKPVMTGSSLIRSFSTPLLHYSPQPINYLFSTLMGTNNGNNNNKEEESSISSSSCSSTPQQSFTPSLCNNMNSTESTPPLFSNTKEKEKLKSDRLKIKVKKLKDKKKRDREQIFNLEKEKETLSSLNRFYMDKLKGLESQLSKSKSNSTPKIVAQSSSSLSSSSSTSSPATSFGFISPTLKSSPISSSSSAMSMSPISLKGLSMNNSIQSSPSQQHQHLGSQLSSYYNKNNNINNNNNNNNSIPSSSSSSSSSPKNNYQSTKSSQPPSSLEVVVL